MKRPEPDAGVDRADSQSDFVVGVISDTHGPLSDRAAAALAGSDHIIHAGDVVDPGVVPALGRIAPITAVRGNMDAYETTRGLPPSAVVKVGGKTFYALHNLYQLDLDPGAAGLDAVIHGHTHKADIQWRDGVLILNPGNAGPAHANSGLSVALVRIAPEGLFPEIIPLD